MGFHVGKNFLDAFPERVYISQLIPAMNQLKRLGEKTGKGFYKVRVARGQSISMMLVCPLMASGALRGIGKVVEEGFF